MSSRSHTMESSVSINRTVYRGMSPGTSNRLEARVKELDDLLDLERDSRVRAERTVNELTFQLEAVQERLDEAGSANVQHSEQLKRREAETIKLRKELEVANSQIETIESSLRKKHQAAVSEMSSEIESLTRAKSKMEKEKNAYLVEIDGMASQLEAALKAKNTAEGKLDNLSAQVNRLNALSADQQKQITDFNALKGRITAENIELTNTVKEYETTIIMVTKTKQSLEVQLDDAKKNLDEESRARQNLAAQVAALQHELDSLQARYEEESEAATSLRAQVSKLNSDLAALKARLERDLIAKTEELEEEKRKFTVRITEVQDLYDREHARANNLDKAKNRLTMELKETQIELDNALATNGELLQRAKAAEALANELSARVDGLERENKDLSAENGRLTGEVGRLKGEVGSLKDKNGELERENKKLTDALRDAKNELRDANRRLADLEALRAQLEAERNNLAKALQDAEKELADKEQKLASAQAALQAMKQDMEARLREKDEELENLRRSTTRIIEELQITIKDIETKYRSEISRLKKKYESNISDLESQIDNLNRINANLAKENRTLASRNKEMEAALDEERRAHENTTGSLLVSEKKRVSLQGEVEDLQGKLETSERLRKAAEGELADASSRVSELSIQVQSLTNDRRRLDADLTAMQGDLEEASRNRDAAEERANRLQAETSRLGDELRQEQDNYKRAETLRKTLEIEIREITIKLEESEAYATREGRRMVAKLQARLRDLEGDFATEQRRLKDAQMSARKFERMYKEVLSQSEEDKRSNLELQDLLDKTQNKLRILKRQTEEAEDTTNIAINKYRKAQQQIDEAESRADMAERTLSVQRGGGVVRSVSISRESSSSSLRHKGRAVSVL